MKNLELKNLGISELKAEEIKGINGGCWDGFCLAGAVMQFAGAVKTTVIAASELLLSPLI